jgi:hypothetical protein
VNEQKGEEGDAQQGGDDAEKFLEQETEHRFSAPPVGKFAGKR